MSASGTNSGPSMDGPGEGTARSSAAPAVKGNPKIKGKGKNDGGKSAELEEQRPKVISPELRGLLSRKVEVLPRKVVRKEGEGFVEFEEIDVLCRLSDIGWVVRMIHKLAFRVDQGVQA
ncbi:MAG: hypothetical protein CL912_09300 [Deltaproteobacteria bacterium]|nr:hypothetical protein [Deltaproteobacteria bacterium]